jgi:ParB-like chromosome segregation protein Spo0J
VPCIVTDADEESKHAIMLHAGIFREQFTPAEEGWQFLELATKYQWSLDRLMRVFKVTEDYINDRVDLVQKDDVIAQAVHTRQINLSQAHELLREKDPERRRTRLLLAIEHGYNAKELRVMRQNLESERAQAQGSLPIHTPPASVAPDPAAVPKCIWCDQGHDPENMRQVWVHWYHLPEVEAICNQVGVKNVLRAHEPPSTAGATAE